MQRSQWEVKTIEPRKIIARKQRKISQVFPSRMTPDLTQESQWNQTYHRPFSTSKICMNVSEHLTLHNGSLIKFFSGNSFVRPNVSAILLVELKRLAFDVFIFAQIHTINHTTTAFRSSDTTNDAEVMFWLKTSSIFAVFANHFFTSKNQTPLLLSVNSSASNFPSKFHLKIPLDGAIAVVHWSRNIRWVFSLGAQELMGQFGSTGIPGWTYVEKFARIFVTFMIRE